MSAEKRTARSVFDLVVEAMSEDEQRTLADQLCAEDPELRARVEQLLVAHRRAQSFLESPPLVAGLDRSIVEPGEEVGSMIGPYRLVEQIGEGGFGHVFVAEQQQPVQRRVALKLIKPGMDSREVVARFEAERQVLAILNHANIAKVFDAGTTSSGRPYFVMELVPGVPITDYCDQHSLSPRERMELFIPVCLAIQHSHQKGVIHRDIKPSNVLVTSQDGRPAAKVIDFGVAKALHGSLTDSSLHTGLHQMLGTPLYMSPEQAGSPSTDVDTRSDIYSLGVLLYELITGTTPFERKRFAKAAFDEIRKIIREEDPPKPSSRLSHSGDRLPNIAALRRIEPARLSKMVQGDLDWIVMKALEKDRARRYSTAENLAKDIERHLHHEPVEAGPPSGWYRMRKLARRHRSAVIASLGLVTLLLAGTAVSLWQAIRATRAEQVAAENGLRAVEEAAVAKAINEFLLHDLLGQADISNQAADFERNRNITVRELLDRAAERIGTKFSGQELTEAGIQRTLGAAYGSLGELEKAQEHLQRAHDLRKKLLGPTHPETLEVLRQLGVVHYDLDRFDDATAAFQTVLRGFRDRFGLEHREVYSSMVCLAYVDKSLGRLDEAEIGFRQALSGLLRTAAPNDISVNDAKFGLAVVLRERRKDAEAETLFRELLADLSENMGRDHPAAISAMKALAVTCKELGKTPEAKSLLVQAVELSKSRLGDDHPQTLECIGDLGGLCIELGQFPEGESLLRESMEKTVAKLGPEHGESLLAQNNLSVLYLHTGQFAKAEPILKQSAETLLRLRGPDHPSTLLVDANLACCCLALGHTDQAESMFRRQLEILRSKLGREHLDTLRCLHGLANCLTKRSQFAEAAPLFREVYEGRLAQLGPDHPETMVSLSSVALLAKALGDFEEAEKLFRQALESRRKNLGVDHPETLHALNKLGEFLMERERWAEAEPFLREAAEVARKKLGLAHPQTQIYIRHHARLLQKQGKNEQADALLKELEDVVPRS